MGRPALITFDVYTALADVESGLVPAIARQAGLDPGSADELARQWRARQREEMLLSNSLGDIHVPFAELTRRALDRALALCGVSVPEPTREALVASWSELPLWDDAGDVVDEIAAREVPMAMLSNGDESALESLRDRWALPIDRVFGADRAGRYKPHRAIYRLALEADGLQPGQVLHVAGSAVDVMGAVAAGLRCVWTNRGRDTIATDSLRPEAELPDLAGLPEVLDR